uniref:Uncharacterized protein n=1 Tax=viral metagenome TaxID=1070528 RepID=A0A6M3L321_9ZZZZ
MSIIVNENEARISSSEITIKLGDKEYHLTIEEARELQKLLNSAFGVYYTPPFQYYTPPFQYYTPPYYYVPSFITCSSPQIGEERYSNE